MQLKETTAEPKDKQRPDPEERYQEIMSLFNFYKRFRSQYDDNAQEYWRLYTGYLEPLDDDDDRSNLHIPLPYESVDTWRSRLLTTFFGNQRPYVNCLPLPVGDMTPDAIVKNIEKGKLAAGLLDSQFERNNIVTLGYDYFTGLLVFPFMAMGVGWKTERKIVKRRRPKEIPADAMGYVNQVVMEIVEEEQTVYDDNYLQLIDYDDFWPDPFGDSLDTFRGVFHREFVTRGELEQYMDALSDIAREYNDGAVYEPDYELEQNVLEFGDSGFDKASFYGEEINTESGFEHGSKYSLFELLHYWTDDEHIIVFNRQQVIFDGPNHFWRHGKKPFIYSSFEPLPKRPIGMSAVQLIEHLSAEIDTQRNQRIDYVAMVLNPMFEVAGDLDESELIWRRAGIIHVNQLGQQVGKLGLENVPQSAFIETNSTKEEAYNTLAVPDVVRGVDANTRQTATYTAAQNTNASIRFDVKLKLWEAYGLKRLAMLMDCNNQQFLDAARLVRQNWQQETVDAWQIVEPWEIQGEWDYRPAGTATDPAANKEIKLQRLAEFLVNSQNDPYVKRGALLQKFVELADLSNNPSEFVKTDEEFQQEQAQQAQEQQMMIEQQKVQRLQEQQATQQFQADQNQQKMIVDIAKQVIAASMKGGEKQGERRTKPSGKKKSSQKQRNKAKEKSN